MPSTFFSFSVNFPCFINIQELQTCCLQDQKLCNKPVLWFGLRLGKYSEIIKATHLVLPHMVYSSVTDTSNLICDLWTLANMLRIANYQHIPHLNHVTIYPETVLGFFPFTNLANMSNGGAFGVRAVFGISAVLFWTGEMDKRLGHICRRMVDAVDALVHV